MKAGRIAVSSRKFEIKDVPIPVPRHGEVRIKVGAAGVCLSDVHFLDGTLSQIGRASCRERVFRTV